MLFIRRVWVRSKYDVVKMCSIYSIKSPVFITEHAMYKFE